MFVRPPLKVVRSHKPTSPQRACGRGSVEIVSEYSGTMVGPQPFTEDVNASVATGKLFPIRIMLTFWHFFTNSAQYLG